MNNEFKFKSLFFFFDKFLFILFLVGIFFIYSTNKVFATTDDNISGYAWNNYVGWISFNCINNNGCADAGGYDYGVDYSTSTKIFSGYAWNNSVGWIAFSGADTPPDNYLFNTNCDSVCNLSNNCYACMNTSDNTVYGWAKILSANNDGWIRLQSATSSDFGITYSGTSGEFSGWAWNDDGNGHGIGWISFNCKNSGTCSFSDYEVKRTDDFLGGYSSDVGNFRGYAWSDAYGWISFSCVNQKTCGNYVDGNDYGVNINRNTYNMSGEAWSENVGWIQFESSITTTTPDDYAFASNCPSTCSQSNDCIACYDPSSGKMHGWARVLSLGDDGWISLDAGQGYSGITLSTSTGEFSGWAWNGVSRDKNIGVGWISFNCLDTNSCPDGTGGNKVSYYVKLINTEPYLTGLSAPNWSILDACNGVAKTAFLKWDVNDSDTNSHQKSFQVIVNDVNTTSTPIYNSGKIDSTVSQLALSNSLNYNTSYYWWVKSWDEFDYASDWVQFFHSELTFPVSFTSTFPTDHEITDNVVVNSSNSSDPRKTFTTYRHEFPSVNFTWSPEKPTQEQESLFISNSYYFTDTNPNVASLCSTSTCDWLWTGVPTTTIIDISSSTEKETTMKFNTGSSSQSVILEVTDSDGYTCSSSSTWDVNVMPEWKEVNPAQ